MDNAAAPADAGAPVSAERPAHGGPPGGRRRPRTPAEKIKARLSGMLFRGAFSSLLIQIGGAGLGIAVQAFLAQSLGAASFGHYVYALTYLNVFAVFARFGLDTAATRYVAAYNATGELGLMRGFMSWGWRRGLFSSVVTGGLVAVAVVIGRYAFDMDAELVVLFLMLALVLPVNARFEIANSTLLAFKHVVRAKAPGTLLRPLILAGGVAVIAYGLKRQVTAAEVMEIYLGSVVAITLLNGYFLHKALPAGLASVQPETRAPEWKATLAPLLMLAALGMLNNSIDVILLGAVGSTTEAGIYAVPTRLVKLIAFGLIAVNSIFPAMISELYAEQKMPELQKLVTLSARVACLFTVPVSLVLVLGGSWILSFYPAEFQQGYVPMVVLSVGQIINASTGSVGYLLAITGRERVSVRILVGSLILNVILNLVLVPIYGMTGAAVGTTVAMIVWNGSMVIAVRRSLGIMATAIGGRYAPRAHRPTVA